MFSRHGSLFSKIIILIFLVNFSDLLPMAKNTSGPKSSRASRDIVFKRESIINKKPKIEKKVSAEVEKARKKKDELRAKGHLIKIGYKDIRDMNYDELAYNKKYYTAKNDYDLVVRYIDRMLTLSKDQNAIRDLKFERAEALFNAGKLEKAAKAYDEWITLYPSHEKTEYVTYKSIQTHFQDMLDPRRDQTATKDTLKLAEKFLEKESNQKYRDEVNIIVKRCNKNLFDAEVNVYDFYLRRHNFDAAQKRLDKIKEDFSNKINKFYIQALEEQFKRVQETKSYVFPKYPSEEFIAESEVMPKAKLSYAQQF